MCRQTTINARSLWQTYDLDKYDFVLLLPEREEFFNKRVQTAFETKLHHRKGMTISGDAARQLVALYSLYEFSGKIIVGSLDEPRGRKLRNLLDCGVATEDELIEDVILGALGGTGG